jgi:hypothetical protein
MIQGARVYAVPHWLVFDSENDLVSSRTELLPGSFVIFIFKLS